MTSPPPGIPRTALPVEVLRASLEALERGLRAVMATVVARRGSAPSTPGQKLLLVEDGRAVGTVGGGAVERAVLSAMRAMVADPSSVPRVDTFRLGPELGMCCGGAVEILLEPLQPAAHVLVVGGGHVGAFAGPLLASLGFRVTLSDPREEAADAGRLAIIQAARASDSPLDVGHAPGPPIGAVEVLLADHDDPEVEARLPEDVSRSAVVVMTHDHQLDQDVIEWALRRGFGFVGGVGSRAKAARTRARLEAKGVPAHDVARVRMPVGVSVSARAPGEIAVAIAAELIAWRAENARYGIEGTRGRELRDGRLPSGAGS